MLPALKLELAYGRDDDAAGGAVQVILARGCLGVDRDRPM